jgi:FlaG/FlaF family flagellin (archaellin)
MKTFTHFRLVIAVFCMMAVVIAAAGAIAPYIFNQHREMPTESICKGIRTVHKRASAGR